MRLDIAKLGRRLVTIVIGGADLQERRAADKRQAHYFNTFGLRADAACLLDQLAQADGRLVQVEDAANQIGRRGQVVDLRPRSPDLCMIDIHDKVGADAIETVDGQGWRITPVGRLRTMRARGVTFAMARERAEK